MCFQSKWSSLLQRVRRDGYEFNLSREYLLSLLDQQEWRCALTGRPIGFDDPDTASPDRIDSNKGYIRGNIQWLHVEINFLKNKWSQESFVQICREVHDHSCTGLKISSFSLLDKDGQLDQISSAGNAERIGMVSPRVANQAISLFGQWMIPGQTVPNMDEATFERVLGFSQQNGPLLLWIRIIPALAERMIEHNISNRNRSNNTIVDMSADIPDWSLNGETIIFSRQGFLNDGQTRLRACIRSGVPFTTAVAFGVERDTRNTVDTGKKRTNADVLTMNGFASSPVLARAAAVVDQYETKHLIDDSNHKVSHTHLLEIMAQHPTLTDETWVKMARSLRGKFSVPEGLFCGLYYLINRHSSAHPLVTGEFFESLRDGLNLTETHPSYLLREFLTRTWRKEKNGGRQQRPSQRHTAAIVIKAWNIFATEGPEGTIKRLVWNYEKESFPAIRRLT